MSGRPPDHESPSWTRRRPLTIAVLGIALVVGVAVPVVGPTVRDALGEFQSVLFVSAAIVGLIVLFTWADGASR